MPSRFNELIEPNKYVSQYVPLPLEAIAAEGAKKQEEFNKSVEEESALSDLQDKVQALDQVKAFGQTYNVGDKDYANKYFNDLNEELSTKADELVKGDKGSSEYKTWLKKKSREINRDLSTGKLGEINAAYKTYQEQQKALQEAKDLNLSPWRAMEIEKSRQGYGVNQGIAGDQRLSTYNVGEYVDRNKELDDLTKGINEELTSLYASPDNQGYIKSGKIEEIKDNKIRNTFRNFLDNSKTKQDIIKEIQYGIADGSIDPNNADKEYANRASAIEEGLVAKYRKSTGSMSLKANPWDLRGADKADAEQERLKAFQLAEQFMPSDPSTANNDNNSTRVIQSVLGDNFQYKDGKPVYNPPAPGSKYVNILGKNIDVDPAYVQGKVNVGGVDFVIVAKTPESIIVRMPNSKGDGWDNITYPIKTKEAGVTGGMVNDANKMVAAAKRVGVNASNMNDALGAVGDYLNKVNNIETSAAAFPPEFSNWLSNQFQVKLDANGKITDPGQLSNVTMKTPDGEVVKDPENNISRLNGANLTGFNRSLTNKKLVPGDMEITGGDGKRYIIQTGLSNLKNATQSSDRLLKSVNEFVINGKRSIDEEQAASDESAISKQLGVPKGLINVVSEEQDYEGNKYITYIHNGPKGVEFKSLVLNSKNQATENPVDIGEASRRLMSSGLAKHLGFFNPKGVSSDAKNYQKYQTESESESED